MECRYLDFRRRLCIRPASAISNAFPFPGQRMGGYKSQDAKAEREFGMTLDHLDTLLQKQKYLCGLCYCQLTADTLQQIVSTTSLDTSMATYWSVVSSAPPPVRTFMSLKGFRYKKLVEFNSDRLRNETKIRGGKLCKKIIGYDANALYIWALDNDMPCGRLTTIEAYDGIVEDDRKT
ncbi:unnamed protein product [Phytophthora lilii]|uniref:Unnamed protein product n=1 Tax=Phytophthora lilii TaxID=2077276 RepID=A0A9W6TBR6_9STRA|nr:unnamed protein product [Phytophthora lilii]